MGESGIRKRSTVGSRPRAIRVSVSLSPDIYRILVALAKQKRVSTAWILRDAADKYVTEHWPLFGKDK